LPEDFWSGSVIGGKFWKKSGNLQKSLQKVLTEEDFSDMIIPVSETATQAERANKKPGAVV
jgi:hypothetical protein